MSPGETAEQATEQAWKDLLDDIKADDDDDIIVTIVPRKGNVTIGGVAIEFLTDDDY